MLSRLLVVPRAALDATACTLRTAADLTDRTAGWLRPSSAAGDLRPADPAPRAGADEGAPAGRSRTGATRARVPSSGAAVAAATAGPARSDEGPSASPSGRVPSPLVTAAQEPTPSTGSGDAPGDEASAPAPVVTAERNPRRSSFSPEALAAAPVRTAVAALDGLSSTELAALYEHESATRNRKTLLRAIEQAVAPSDPLRPAQSPLEAAQEEALTAVADVDTAPDSDTVYSTTSS